jgi:hypothetical protein
MKNLRVRLAPPQIPTADIDAERIEQAPVAAEVNLPHHLVGVFR